MRYTDMIEFVKNEKTKRLQEMKRIYNIYYPY
jgi:hypothetical protein